MTAEEGSSLCMLLCAPVLFGLVLVPILFAVRLGPEARARHVLRRAAQEHYSTARGTLHLALLRHAHPLLIARRDALHKDAERTRRDTARSEEVRDQGLRHRLTEHLVHTDLRKLPGLGPQLHQRLVSQVFRNELDDLLRAERVRGVGPRRQAAISRWVAETKRRMPELLAGDFAHKQDILCEHEAQNSRLQSDLAALWLEQKRIGRLVAINETTIAPLASVSKSDFVRALREPGHRSDDLDRYCRGVFGEWEETPDWFREVVKVNAGG